MKKRECNIELLRLFSIILIIAFHLQRSDIYRNSIYNHVIQSVGIWGCLGVDCFICIMAWFMVDVKIQDYKIHKIFKVLSPTIFYSLVFLFVKLVWDSYTKNIGIFSNLINLEKNTVNEPSPLWGGRYWYVTCYLILYLLAPFLNMVIHQMTEKTYIHLILVLSALQFYNILDTSNICTNTVTFIYIYFLIGYIKKFREGRIINTINPFVVAVIMMFICVLVRGINLEVFGWRVVQDVVCTYQRSSMWLIAISLFLFQGFRSLKNIPFQGIVNNLASYTLGIYLFHENSLFNIADLMPTIIEIVITNPIMNYVVSILMVFAVGSIVECVRMKFAFKINSFINRMKTEKRRNR